MKTAILDVVSRRATPDHAFSRGSEGSRRFQVCASHTESRGGRSGAASVPAVVRLEPDFFDATARHGRAHFLTRYSRAVRSYFALFHRGGM
jgi:hypothetical protein